VLLWGSYQSSNLGLELIVIPYPIFESLHGFSDGAPQLIVPEFIDMRVSELVNLARLVYNV